MTAHANIFSGGFADPVISAQAVFRLIMDGLASPARIVAVAETADAPAPSPRAMSALALTLLDHDTAVWLSPALSGSSFPQWLAFHTGARLVSGRMDCDFALVGLRDGFPDFTGFPLGSDTYPDRSAMLVVEVEALEGGERLIARGPGIRETRELSPRGLPQDFLRQWTLNQGLYPRGLDLILVAGAEFLCLPRTTRLTKREA